VVLRRLLRSSVEVSNFEAAEEGTKWSVQLQRPFWFFDIWIER
jgi:hypothetical protein